jgi:hypothetical protein
VAEKTNAAPRQGSGAQTSSESDTHASREDGRNLTVLDALRAAREVTHHDGRKVTAQEKNLLAALARYWPNVHPGLGTLARDTGMSRTRVAEWLRELEARGLITTRQRGRGLTAARELHLPGLSS